MRIRVGVDPKGVLLDASAKPSSRPEEAATQGAPHLALDQGEIAEFVTAWEADFGEVLSQEEARSEALHLLHFFGTLEESLRLEDSSQVEDKTQ